MELQPGQVRVHYGDGTNSIIPHANLARTIEVMGNEEKHRGEADRKGAKITGVDYYKEPETALPPMPAAPVIAPVKDKASLLGDVYNKEKGKADANKVIDWIGKCDSLEDLGIVMKDETRATVKKAYLERTNELV